MAGGEGGGYNYVIRSLEEKHREDNSELMELYDEMKRWVFEITNLRRLQQNDTSGKTSYYEMIEVAKQECKKSEKLYRTTYKLISGGNSTENYCYFINRFNGE